MGREGGIVGRCRISYRRDSSVTMFRDLHVEKYFSQYDHQLPKGVGAGKKKLNIYSFSLVTFGFSTIVLRKIKNILFRVVRYRTNFKR